MGEALHQWQRKWQKHTMLILRTNIQQLNDQTTQRLSKCKQNKIPPGLGKQTLPLPPHKQISLKQM